MRPMRFIVREGARIGATSATPRVFAKVQRPSAPRLISSLSQQERQLPPSAPSWTIASPKPLAEGQKQSLMHLLQELEKETVIEMFPVQAAERFDIDDFADALVHMGDYPGAAVFGVWVTTERGPAQLAGIGRIRPDGCGNMIADIAVHPDCDSEEITQKLLLAQIDHAQQMGATLLRLPRARLVVQEVVANIAAHLRLAYTADYRLMDRAGGRPSMDLRLPVSDLRMQTAPV